MSFNILVTGGRGFIGTHLVERLIELNHNISIIDNDNADIKNFDKVKKIFIKEQPDFVIHLAAKAGVTPSVKDPQLYIDTNITGTLNVLEMCRVIGCKNFIFASTSSVYGDNLTPFHEGMPLLKTYSPYATTKIAGEQLCSNYANLYNINIVCLRFFTVYGPKQRPDLAIFNFIKNINNNLPIIRYGNGNTQRDYTYVSDIVEGIINTIDYIKGRNNIFDIFNIGKGESTSLSDLITIIEKKINKKAIIEQRPERKSEMPITIADISKAKNIIGYNPKISIVEGISKMVDFLACNSFLNQP